MPEAGSAGGRPEMRRMNCDDRLEAGLRVGDEVDFLMCVKIRQAPGRRHVVEMSDVAEMSKMGRSRGLEPPTPGTTNQCSNQLSYDRHRNASENHPLRRLLRAGAT